MRRRIAQVLADVTAQLAAAGFDEPRRQARRVAGAALNLPEAEIFAHPERALDRAERARIEAMLGRLLAHEPLSRIAGRREFWGLDFALSPDTLDPRPDSETVVAAVLARLPDRAAPLRLLDLGTGTGCLLLALLSELPNASGVGVDIAIGAALTARANARGLGLAGRAAFLVGDWGAALSRGFDAIVANPPYIATAALARLPPEVAGYDPVRALDGGVTGLFAYRAIAADLPRLLAPQGLVAVEIGEGQAEPVAAILAKAGFALDTVEPDLAGIPRCVVARLPSPTGTEGRPAARIAQAVGSGRAG